MCHTEAFQQSQVIIFNEFFVEMEFQVCESGKETLFSDKCNSVLNTINVVVFWREKHFAQVFYGTFSISNN